MRRRRGGGKEEYKGLFSRLLHFLQNFIIFTTILRFLCNIICLFVCICMYLYAFVCICMYFYLYEFYLNCLCDPILVGEDKEDDE